MSSLIPSVLALLYRANTWLQDQVFNGEISVNGWGSVSKRIAKTRLTYNMVSQTILDSMNVSSVTHNAGGNITANFTSSFADANYQVGHSVEDSGFPKFVSTANKLAGSCDIIVRQAATGTGFAYVPIDMTHLTLLCVGN